MKRVAVIGLGEIAKVHVPILMQMPEVELCAVCDLREERGKLASGVPFYTDYHQMLAEQKPDCVHLCLPHWLHYPVAKDVVEAGINVFCEKPLALNAGQAREFAKLEQDHPEVKIGLCLQNRYNETTEELLRIIQSGEEGAVTSVRASVVWARSKSYYDAEPWRGKMETAGGGVMINQSIHTLDLMEYLGGEIATIRGNICQLLDYGWVEVEDTASAHILYKNGAVGTFFATVSHAVNTNVEIAVELEKSSYLIQDNKLYKINDGEKVQLAEDARLPGAKFYYGASHAKLIRIFYEDLEKGGRRYPCAADGVMSMRMIDAIRASSASGKPEEV